MNYLPPIDLRLRDLAGEDDPDAVFLAAREAALEDFNDWVRNGIRGLRECDDNPREYVDFSDWLIERARSYPDALDYMERRAVGRLTGSELVATAVNHRKFLRETRS